MKVNNLPAGYYKASTESGFYFWDGFGANKPNQVKGRLLLIGCYDMTRETQFGCVKYASTKNYDLTFADANTCSSQVPELLLIDGIFPQVNDRILLKDQTNKAQNGIYLVEKIGSDSESFELRRASDASSVVAMATGKFVFITGGDTLVNHCCQLMPYDTKKSMGSAEFCFIDLTAEGFYATTTYGFRLLNSIICTDIDAVKSTYSFASPGFINTDCQRLLKILVSYDIPVKTVMENLMTKEFEFDSTGSAVNGNGVVSGNLVCNNTYSYCG